MASKERTAYPEFARSYSDLQLQQQFSLSDEELAWARRARRPDTQLALAVLRKSFQCLGRFPGFKNEHPEDGDQEGGRDRAPSANDPARELDIPPEVVDHVRKSLRFGPRIQPDFGASLFEHKKKVITEEGASSFYGGVRRAEAEAQALKSAEVKDHVVDIINEMIEDLVTKGVELPRFSTLNRIAQAAHNEVEQRVVSTVVGRIGASQREELLGLLNVDLTEKVSQFNRLKKNAGSATRKHLDQLIAHQRWVDRFGNLASIFEGVLDSKIRYFGRIAKQLDVSSLRDYPEDKRLVCILSLIRLMQTRIRDQMAEMFLKRMGTLVKLAKRTLEETRVEKREAVHELVATLGGVVDIIAKESDNAKAGAQIRDYVTASDTRPVAEVQARIEDVSTYTSSNHLPFLWDHFATHRAALFRWLGAIELEATDDTGSLMAAIQIVKANQDMKREWLIENVDLSFCSVKWQQLVYQERGDGKAVNRRLFEVCVFAHIASQLRSGDLAIPNSEEYADHRKDLLPWSECEKRVDAHCARIGIPNTARGFRDYLFKELTDAAAALDARFPEHAEDVTLGEDGRPILKRVEARQIPDSALLLREEITKRMPERHLMECLENAEHWFGVTRHFSVISGNEAKFDFAPSRYLMAIFAMGTNLGPAQAARHFRGAVSEHQIGMVNRRHITVESLDNALRQVTNVYLGLDLPKLWGQGTTVSADGTHYNFFEDNLISGLHFRYLKTGAVAYRHVADNYIAVFRHFIGPSIHESIYTIEGLMNAGVNVEADTVYSDTQGQSASVFCYSLFHGIKLMPRIRNWKDLRLVRPTASTEYEHIDRLFKDVVDWDEIEAGWKDVMQVSLSIAEGRISSARVLRKLSSHSRRNKAYFAARTIGEVLRTCYLLRWIGDREMRQEVTANTNKIESYHAFSKWTGFGGDVISTNEPEEQQKRLRYIDLVAGLIILQNAVDMSRIIERLRQSKTITVNEADLEFLSPYLTEHVLRFGKYDVRLNRPKEAWISEPQFAMAAELALRCVVQETTK